MIWFPILSIRKSLMNGLKYVGPVKTTSTVFAAYAIVCLLPKPNQKTLNALSGNGKR